MTESTNTYAGFIELIIGPMFSGKSTELMRKVKRYSIAQKKCLTVNYAKDNRYSQDNCIATHDNQMLRAMKCHTLEELLPIYKDYDVVAIDEGQFFSDIVEKSEIFANAGKTVIVAALDATFQRKPFGRVLELIPMAEKITKLSAVCVVCNSDAFFTQRISEDSQVELIGGNDIYRAVCRKCFYESTKKDESKPTTSEATTKTAITDSAKNSPTSEKTIVLPTTSSSESILVEKNINTVNKENLKIMV